MSTAEAVAARAEPRVSATARRRAWRRNVTGYLFIAPWLFAFLAFTFLPIAGSALLAFTDYNVLSQSLHWIGFDNFELFIVDAAGEKAEWLAERGTSLSTSQKKLVADTCSYVSENPLKSVGIAVLAGFLLSRILL